MSELVDPMTQEHGRWESLRAIRTRSGYSIRALAKAAGMSPSTLSELERGAHLPTPATTRKLAEALRVPITAIERKTP